jgi:DNA-binding transcriptional MerR regulator
MYRIGEFSRLTHIPVKTLRYYDAIGLLRPARVDRATGYRHYTPAEVERLNRILVFRDLGFTLAEIAGLVSENVPAEQIRGMLQIKRDELERTVERERERLGRAAARLALIERSGHTAAHDVAVREVGPRLIASIRDTLRSYDECEGLLDEIARDVGPHRQRGAIWHTCAAGGRSIDCEAFVFLPSRVSAGGRVAVQELPGHLVASLVYRGELDFEPPYQAMRAWLSVSRTSVVGATREIFLGAGDDGEPLIEIQLPIAPRPLGARFLEALPA